MVADLFNEVVNDFFGYILANNQHNKFNYYYQNRINLSILRLLHVVRNGWQCSLVCSMPRLTQPITVNALSCLLLKTACPHQHITVTSSSREEVALLRKRARIYLPIVTVHRVSQTALPQIPDLHIHRSTLISLFPETEVTKFPEG